MDDTKTTDTLWHAGAALQEFAEPKVISAEARIEGRSSLRVAERHFGVRPVEIFGDRWVKQGYKIAGRKPADPALIQELRGVLEAHWQSRQRKPKQQEGIDFIQQRTKHLSRVSIERRIVRPVYQKLWPRPTRRVST
jgi:hypothetical protein